MIIVSLVVTASILFSKSEETSADSSNWSDQLGKTEENVTHESLGPGAIIKRATWGGKPPLFKRELIHPTGYVIISHTATPRCLTVEACSARVLSIQGYHVGSLKSPDIGYNFLVGGDGNVYVGRGWDVRNFHSNNSVGISFIGNYLYDNLTSEMIEIVQRLLAEGIVNGKLSEDYKLVAHNQTFATESPGLHVYDVISRWSHFHAGRVIIQ